MLVADILRKQYTRLEAEDDLHQIAQLFAERHIASAPVQKNDQFLGVVSDKDIFAALKDKKYAGLWYKDRPTPFGPLLKITAGQLARKPPVSVTSDMTVEQLVPLVAKADIDLIPVVDDTRLVGIVRGYDLMNILLSEFAKYELDEHAVARAPAAEGGGVSTVVDQILAMVREKKSVTMRELVTATQLPRSQLEKIAKSLEEHHLIILEYQLMKDLTLKEMRHE